MRIKVAILMLMIFFISHSSLASNNEGGGILRKGAWALSPYQDPFNRKYPVVGYLPPGTIIFESKKHDVMKKYIEVLTHFGHKVLIEEFVTVQGKKMKSVTPFKGVVEPPRAGNNRFIIHEDILCLNEQDRIKVENERCYFKKRRNAEERIRSTPKLGKGWIYSFKPKEGSSTWLSLKAQLDNSTKKKVKSYGLEVVNANFDIPIDELNDHEESGFITLLNKEMPLIKFEYKPETLFYLNCGLEKVDRKYIEGRLSANLSAKTKRTLSSKIFSWITGIEGTIQGDGSVGKEKETTVTISTKESSYLFYDVIMRERNSDEESMITVRKEFNCSTGAVNKPGLNITEIKFTIKHDEFTDPDVYVFGEKDIIINTPEENKKTIGRPVYISVNSASQQNKMLKYITEKYNVNMQMAHFMLVNINNSCKAGRKNNIRDKCLELSKTN